MPRETRRNETARGDGASARPRAVSSAQIANSSRVGKFTVRGADLPGSTARRDASAASAAAVSSSYAAAPAPARQHRPDASHVTRRYAEAFPGLRASRPSAPRSLSRDRRSNRATAALYLGRKTGDPFST